MKYFKPSYLNVKTVSNFEWGTTCDQERNVFSQLSRDSVGVVVEPVCLVGLLDQLTMNLDWAGLRKMSFRITRHQENTPNYCLCFRFKNYWLLVLQAYLLANVATIFKEKQHRAESAKSITQIEKINRRSLLNANLSLEK